MSIRAALVTTEMKFGQVELTFTDANHVYATNHGEGTPSGRVTYPTVIRGRDIGFWSAHLYRWTDGVFHVGTEHSTNDGFYGGSQGVTRHQQASLIPELEAAVNAVAVANPVVIETAEILALTTAIERAVAKRKELQEQVKAHDAEIAELNKRLNLLPLLVGHAG